MQHAPIPHYGVKEAVFPFNMFPEVDPLLGPEMRSTGEVLGLADTFGEAFFKAQEAAQQTLPLEGTVLITVAEKDRPAVVEVARQFAELNFTILATAGTAACLARHGIAAQVVNKMHEGRPHIVDLVKNREIHLIVNTPGGQAEPVRRFLHPQERHQVQGALHHHAGRRAGGGQGNRGAAAGGRGRGQVRPAVSRRHRKRPARRGGQVDRFPRAIGATTHDLRSASCPGELKSDTQV